MRQLQSCSSGRVPVRSNVRTYKHVGSQLQLHFLTTDCTTVALVQKRCPRLHARTYGAELIYPGSPG